MKYRDIIHFESIDEIIKFDKLDNEDYRERLVKTFVCSQAFENFIIPRISRELDLESTQETKGLQIVGNYGTGKSHLMSLFSIIAENEKYLDFLSNERAKESLRKIAGKYKVIRFEISGTNSLWEMITYQIDKYFEQWGVDYSICDDNRPVPYYDKLEKMMAAFEEVFPDKGFMFVIDEMLSYLHGHAQPQMLNSDLQVLQALGHMSDRTKFRMVFGVQELIYQVPEFQFEADMLIHCNDRYIDLKIEKSDVQFIVQERLLHKDAHQQQSIRDHLKKFTHLFPDMGNDLETFVKLYPVHPSYFDNFQQIRIGKSQREVLKTLSNRFESMLEDEIPTNEPGLICYDSYWADMQRSQDLMAIPDVRKVAEITSLVDQKIEEWFQGGRAPKKPLAHRIVAASAIKILQADLTKTNGVIAESLANDLCYVDSVVNTFDELVDLSINTTLANIVKATIGQYFELNENNLEYHLRIEGGVNYKQNVINYAATMSDSVKDQYFFEFLVEFLPVDWDVYRPNFKIWAHTINWKSHFTRLPGYIFMGNPNAKSTTQPQQHFYLYFMPIFEQAAKAHSIEDDGIFFLLDNLSEEFKEAVTLYGASLALHNSSNSAEKINYKVVHEEFKNSARNKFNAEFLQKVIVEFNGKQQPLSALNPQGDSKIDMLSNVASTFLEDIFCHQSPDYPKFTNLQLPLTPSNRENLLRAARGVIVNPQQNNRNGEAILYGLGLWNNGHLSIENSMYAKSLSDKLSAKGGQVVNQSEILKLFYDDEYISVDFGIEADLEFIVMSAMAQLGEIEIVLSDDTHINASNIQKILTLNEKDFYTFKHIAQPKGINIPLIRELSLGFLGQDKSGDLDNPQFYADILLKAQDTANRAVLMAQKLKNGCDFAGVEIINPLDASSLCHRLEGLKGLCDQMKAYNSKAKLRNIPWTKDVIHEKLSVDKVELEKLEILFKEMDNFQSIISYLSQAKEYVADATLKQEIVDAINKLGTVIPKGVSERARYMEELKQMKERYADYYLKAYLDAHLPATQETNFKALQNMPERQVCEEIFESAQADSSLSILNTFNFEQWKKKLESVLIADPNVTKQTILQISYQGFNPVAAGQVFLPNLTDLKVELQDIYAELQEQMKDAFEDSSVQNNRQMLSGNEITLLDQFVSGKIKLSSQYVPLLLEIIKKLYTNFEIEEISFATIKSKFNRPLDVASAKKVLNAIIDDIANRQRQKGKKEEDIRIIIK